MPGLQYGAVLRWVFDDGTEEWTVPINPNEMTSPFPTKNVSVQGTVRVTGKPIVFEGNIRPAEWQFSGVILDSDHYSKLLAWANKRRRIWITDHFGRLLDVYLTGFKPTPKRSQRYWRHDYEITALVFSVGDPSPAVEGL